MTSTLVSSPTDVAPLPGTDPAPDRSRHRATGGAAIVKAATYLAGFVVLGAWLAPAGYGQGDAAAQLSFMLDHQAVLYAWHALLYLVGGLALVVLALGLDDVLAAGTSSRLLRRSTLAIGLLWAGLLVATGLVALVGQTAVVELHQSDVDQATTAWATLQAVQEAFGGGIEVVGGVWSLLVAWAGARSPRLGRGPARLAVVAGVAGVATVVPALAPLGAVFGLGLLAWFTWIGLRLVVGRA